MLNTTLQPFVSFMGVILQFVAAALLAMLFLLLRVHARRRRYFYTWALGWLALAVALAAEAVRYVVTASPTSDPPDERTLRTLAFWGVYQLGKLLFIALLAVGTSQFARGIAPERRLRMLLPPVLLYALASLVFADSLREIMVWQMPLAIVGFGWCAVQIGALAPSRQGIGTHLSGSVLAIMALTAVVYLFAFGYAGPEPDGGALATVARYAPYLDLVLYLGLGFAMVIVMMEDAKREVDAANAELSVAHSVMRRAALYDSLTGCLNRRAFTEGVGLATAHGGFGAVMMFDLDDLKDINDAYGHSAGDALLRHLTDSLRAELRPSDKLYRWGGDEFLMLLPGADEVRARARLETVLRNVAVLRLGPHADEVRLNVSMGTASYGGAEQLPVAIEAADAMMYREKTRRKAARA